MAFPGRRESPGAPFPRPGVTVSIRPLVQLTPPERVAFRRGAALAGAHLSPGAVAALAGRGVDTDAPGAARMIQGLQAVDRAQMLRAGKDRPRVRHLIRRGALRYRRRDDREHWQTYRELLLSRGGDCEDLAAAYAAELQVDGWDPDARAVVYHVRPGLSHVVVYSPRYGWIDPSRLAGMGAP